MVANNGNLVTTSAASELVTSPTAVVDATTAKLTSTSSEPSSSFFDSLKSNPYFSAGFGLVGIGALLSILKRSSSLGYTLAQKNLTVSLELMSKDRSYEWVLKWINAHLAKRAQHISVETYFQKNDKNERVSTFFSFVPSTGTHYFKYKNTWIRADRTRETMVDRNTGSPVETLKLIALGRDPSVFHSLLQEARGSMLEKQIGKTLIYLAGLGTTDWGLFGHPRDKRAFGSVVLDKNIAENIKHDIREFLSSSKWYYDRGIPFRRGYLLYGPPGCGKTSFITALAAEINHDIAILNLSDRGLTDDRLNVLFSKAPLNSIVLLEDIDSAFLSREYIKKNPKAYEGFSPLTLSGLLNALDGVSSSEGRIVFMTTNYIDRLDPALIRPGRVDYKQHIGYASEHQMRAIFMNFYPPNETSSRVELETMGDEFAFRLAQTHLNFSPAELQGYLMFFKNAPKMALEKLDDLIRDKQSQQSKQVENLSDKS